MTWETEVPIFKNRVINGMAVTLGLETGRFSAAGAGISFIYAFAIAWFTEFIWIGTGMAANIMKFYSVGLIPLLLLFTLLGVCIFTENLQQIYRNHNNKKLMQEEVPLS